MAETFTPVDISSEVEPINMPLCPLCDEEIRNGWGDVCIAESGEALALVHAACVELLFPKRRNDN